MDKPRILLVSCEPIFNLGGVGKTVQWLIDGLGDRYRFSLAAPDVGTSETPPGWALALSDSFAIPARRWAGSQVRDLRSRIKAGNIDLVHFHGGTFTFDAHLPWRSPLHRLCLGGVPWILTNHAAPSLTQGLFPPNYPAPARALKTALAWSSKCFLLGFCRQEVFASDENRSQIARWFPWAAGKMRTIYNSGLEGDPPAPVVREEAVTIGNLGHISWRKGQHVLLTAFSMAREKRPRLRLILAGPGHDECAQWLHDEVARRKLEDVVRIPGGLTDKTGFWEAVDIYVQPSLFEGAPMALMEALWLGKPAVGTRVSGIPEMIEDGKNGFLVEPDNPGQMAEALVRLADDFETRRRFSQGAGRLEEKGMTRSAMCRNYAALYDLTLG